MPLAHYTMDLIASELNHQFDSPGCTGKVLCFSTPDVIVADAHLKQILTDDEYRKLEYRSEEDSKSTIAWHKSQLITPGPLVDTRSLFAALGWQMDAVDIVEGRGGEIIHDLSHPLPAHLCGQYDLVFDIVTNQCFDVVQAMRNAVLACRPGGAILHVTPVAAPNQGFWSVSPTVYADFYREPEFSILYHELVDGPYEKKLVYVHHPVSRLKGVPDDTMNVVLVRKHAANPPAATPIMTKFKTYPLAKG